MIKLLEIGSTGLIELNKEWIPMIKEFRNLIARDKGSKGDVGGRYKKQAIRELTYIYLMYDFRSPFENYSEEDKREAALHHSGLTAGEVESDDLIADAIRIYVELQNNSSKTLQGWRKMKKSADTLATYIEDVDLTERTDTGNKVHSMKEYQDAIKGMPQTYKAIDELEEEVRRQLADTGGVRANKTKGIEEDPEGEGSWA